MSDCSIRLNPRIDEPSNISSLSSAFSSSSTGIETFLTAPYGSVNCSRTNATLSRAAALEDLLLVHGRPSPVFRSECHTLILPHGGTDGRQCIACPG